jgi:hypothetical protein
MFRFGDYKAVTEGYLEFGFDNFEPGNFILVSDGIRADLVQVDSGDAQKHQGTAYGSAQISTKATPLMVRVRDGVFGASWGQITAFYQGNFPS